VSAKDKKPAGPFAALKELKQKLAADEAAKGSPVRPASTKNVPPKNSTSVEVQDEEVSFHRLMSGVAPLANGPTRRLQTCIAEDVRPPSHSHEARRTLAQQGENDAIERLRGLVSVGAKFEVTDDGVHVEGRRHDTRPDVVRKLRRGQFPIDARLDLHGMVASEAKDALSAFLASARARREKCVLVIAGQGHHSPQGVGVLRGELAAWLSQGASSHTVAAFCSAVREDGGMGAMYVLLVP